MHKVWLALLVFYTIIVVLFVYTFSYKDTCGDIIIPNHKAILHTITGCDYWRDSLLRSGFKVYSSNNSWVLFTK